VSEEDKKMFCVRILRPNAFPKKKEVCCSVCKLSYTKEDYSSLFKSKKLLYFKLKAASRLKKLFCHSCLFAAAQKIIKKQEIDKIFIKVIDGKKNFLFKFQDGEK